MATVEVVIRDGVPCYRVEHCGMTYHRHDRWQAEILIEQIAGDALPPEWYTRPLGSRSLILDDSPEPDPGV